MPDEGFITVNEYTWNRPVSMTYPGGSTKEFSYDPLMRVKQITSKDPGQNILLNYQYNYDRMDNITDKVTDDGGYGYGYDDLYRLTAVDNPEAVGLADEGFTYDNVGNRLTSAATAGYWGYNDNNELTGYDDTVFVYDDNGNMIQKSVGGVVTSYVYNIEDRLTEVWNGEASTGSLTASYYYDPFGRRLWKDVGGVRTYFHYSDEGLIGEYEATGAEIKTYGYKPGSTWTTDPLFMKVGSNYYFYHNDHLGTPQKMTATNGAIVWSAKYESFGKAAVEVETVVNNLRFPGQYYDSETRLHYNLYRYYAFKVGRYLRCDPIGLARYISLYNYVNCNPIRYKDPYGLEVWGGIPNLFPDFDNNGFPDLVEKEIEKEFYDTAKGIHKEIKSDLMIIGKCSVKCTVELLVGETGFDGSIATEIWTELGEEALKQAAKRCIKTGVVNLGEKALPILGQVATVKSAVSTVKCAVNCALE